MSSGKIAVSKFPKGIVLGAVRAGILEATLDMKGRMKDRGSWRTSGHIRFDEGTIHVEDFKVSSGDAFVTLRFDQDRIHIPRLAFHGGRVICEYPVDRALADHPMARLVVESSQIDLDAF